MHSRKSSRLNKITHHPRSANPFNVFVSKYKLTFSWLLSEFCLLLFSCLFQPFVSSLLCFRILDNNCFCFFIILVFFLSWFRRFSIQIMSSICFRVFLCNRLRVQIVFLYHGLFPLVCFVGQVANREQHHRLLKFWRYDLQREIWSKDPLPPILSLQTKSFDDSKKK